jgi:hypothetical protein
MTRLFLNGQYLIGGEGKDNDYWFEKGGLFFGFALTGNSTIIVERLCLGILWSRKVYRVDKFPKNTNVLASRVKP